MTPENLEKNAEFGFGESLDANGIKKAIDNVISKYCSIFFGKTEAECQKDLTGCGLDDNCVLGETCVNAESKTTKTTISCCFQNSTVTTTTTAAPNTTVANTTVSNANVPRCSGE